MFVTRPQKSRMNMCKPKGECATVWLYGRHSSRYSF